MSGPSSPMTGALAPIKGKRRCAAREAVSQASARKKRIGELPTERLTIAANALGLA